MELTVLSVPGCPNARTLEDRISIALTGYVGVVVYRRVVGDELGAAKAGMRGSPTLLIEGVDPFAGSDRLPSLSCRLYRDADGRIGGAPSVEALRRVIEEASRD